MPNRLTELCVVAALAAGLLAGCASEEQYNEAVTANRMAQKNLEACRDRARILEDEKNAIQAALAERDAEIAARDTEINRLEQANEELGEALVAMKGKAEGLREDFEELRNRQIRVLPIQVDAAIKRLAAQHGDLVEYDEEYGMVKLKSDLTFAKGSADVSDTASAALKQLANIISGGQAGDFGIYVAGHTDDIPVKRAETRRQFRNNWGLSAFRAISVVEVLTEAGVDARRMAAIGFGKNHPIEANRPNNKGNAANRRVEIWIVPGRPFLSADAGGATPAGGS